jgi:hypothetical protein
MADLFLQKTIKCYFDVVSKYIAYLALRKRWCIFQGKKGKNSLAANLFIAPKHELVGCF